jgi:pyroglutamyl-peptidase
MKALVTGFDAFGGDAINPSYEAVRRLPRMLATRGQKLTVTGAELPTSFARAARRLRELIAREQPDIVLCVGLAAERDAISIERVAVNLCSARIADNDGLQPADTPVMAGGPAAYFSTLPVSAILKALARAGLKAEMSMSAGTFVCNHVFYHLMREAARARRGHRIRCAGFVHVPALPADDPRTALREYVRALRIVLSAAQRATV